MIHDSAVDFEETPYRFDEQVPMLDPLRLSDSSSIKQRGMTSRLTWIAVVGPTGFVALTRIDQGALFSLGGDPVQATLYLVGNPVIARSILAPMRLSRARRACASSSPLCQT